MGGNQQTLSAERETKQSELETEQRKLEQLNQAGAVIKSAVAARNDKLVELEAVYKEYSKARRALCERITKDSDGKVRVTVAEQGNRAIFGERLKSLKVGSYIAGSDIDAIVANVTPKELVGAVLNYDLKTDKREASLQPIATKARLDLEVVRKLAEHMLAALRRNRWPESPESADYQQFILTSHSSNLAVASDTDCYAVLTANASAARLVQAGSLDGSEVRMEVLKVREGGRKAYDLKSRKYGIDVDAGTR